MKGMLRGMLFLMCMFPMAGHALIDLDFRPDYQHVPKGSIVSIKLFAVSDNSSNQLLSAMDVVIRWDPNFLNPISFTNVGNGYSWQSSGFFPGSINNSLADGDAMWTAWARPGDPAAATPAGLHVTTFRFTALANTLSTTVEIVPSFNGFQTVVFDGTIPNTPVTGQLDSTSITITPWVPPPGGPIGSHSESVPEPTTFSALGAALLAYRLSRRSKKR
jgi:hypothetical protein